MVPLQQANASTINDKAAAVVLMSKNKAKELDIDALASIISYSDAQLSQIGLQLHHL